MDGILREQRLHNGPLQNVNKQQLNQIVGGVVSFVKKEFPCIDIDGIRRNVPEIDRFISDAEKENARLISGRSCGNTGANGAAFADSLETPNGERSKTRSCSLQPTSSQRGGLVSSRRQGGDYKLVKVLAVVGTVAAIAAVAVAEEALRGDDKTRGSLAKNFPKSLPVQNIGQLMNLLSSVGIQPHHIMSVLAVVTGFLKRELGVDIGRLINKKSLQRLLEEPSPETNEIKEQDNPMSTSSVETTEKKTRVPLLAKLRRKQKQTS